MNEDNSNPDLAPDSELDAGPDTTGWDVPPRSQRAAKSVTQLRAMSAGVLVPEAIVLALSAPVLMFNAELDKSVALAVGLGLGVACLLVTGMLGRPWAYWVGHAIQVVAVGLGFFVPLMFFIGGIFALLWGSAWFLGQKIAREKLAAWDAWDAEQLSEP